MRKYFGTDGIRGTANSFPMTAEMALKLGMAAGKHFTRGDHRHTVVIGKDTRLSGYLLEPALTAGFISMGMDVVLLGPLPTPAVALMTRSLRADLGVMISASHNPFQDNGIKLFGPDGFKLSDDDELTIESYMDGNLDDQRAPSHLLGRARRLDDAGGRYIEFAKSTFPRGMRLDGLKIVLDCANGAAYKVAPAVLWELGAEIITLADKPDGTNINKNCGSTHTENLAQQVVAHGAHIGLALDGDADRLIVVDEMGHSVDGDQVLALVARNFQNSGLLRGGAIIATKMSNMGLEKYAQSLGLDMIRADVGDRYVLEQMRARGCNVGGEPSGHIVLTDYATTGDGLVAGLQVLAALVESGLPASKLLKVYEAFPMKNSNVRVVGLNPAEVLERHGVRDAITHANDVLAGRGRTLIRKSGTEPLIRVQAEGDSAKLVDKVVADIVAAIEKEIAKG